MVLNFNDNRHGHSFNVAYDTIMSLSNSQGLYSRMRLAMEEQDWIPLYELTKENYFSDALDFIMFIEC